MSEISKLFDDDEEFPETNNKVVNIGSVKKNNNPTIVSSTSPFEKPYYTTSIFEAKEFIKLVKNTEKHIRTSTSYKEYLGILRHEYGLNNCAVFGNIKDDDMATIEFHHYPFTLYDICAIVLECMLIEKRDLSTLTLAQEVMKCHYQHIVGLVPLSKTPHKLTHAGKLFINLKQVFGNVGLFITRYELGINDEYISKFNLLVERSLTSDVDDGGMLNIGFTSWNIQKIEMDEDDV